MEDFKASREHTFPLELKLLKKLLSTSSSLHCISFCLFLLTPRQKSIRALEIVLAIFLCFECQFLSFYACYKEYKA